MAKTQARSKPAKRATAKPAARTNTSTRTDAPKPVATKQAAKPKAVTRTQALDTIRALVEAKKQRSRQPPSWPGANPHQHRAPEASEQSADEAAGVDAKRANEQQAEAGQQAQRDKRKPRGAR